MQKKTFSADYTKSLVKLIKACSHRAYFTRCPDDASPLQMSNELLPFGIIILSYIATRVKIFNTDLYRCTKTCAKIVQYAIM